MNDGSASYNMKALRAAHEVGIRHILGDGTLRSYVMQAKTLYDSGAKTEEELVQGVKDIIEPYTTSEYADALYGFMIQDEPDASKFDAIAFGEKIFKQAAPDLMFYVNLFPVIAGGAQLSGSDEPIKYDSYLTQYFAKVKTDYVSYDHYPLYGDGVTTSIEASFLYNMDLMRAKIDEEGEDRALWTFLQSIQYGGKNRRACEQGGRDVPGVLLPRLRRRLHPVVLLRLPAAERRRDLFRKQRAGGPQLREDGDIRLRAERQPRYSGDDALLQEF